MQSPLLSISHAYDRQQVIYIFDKMRAKVNTQRLYVKCNTQRLPPIKYEGVSKSFEPQAFSPFR